MKKLIIILLLFTAARSFGQGFPSTDSLHRYDNRFITNSAINAFTDYRLNTLLHGMINWIDSARLGTGGTVGMDTLYTVNDSTLRYKKNSVTYTFTFKGVYDSRKKVDTLYAVNDSTIGFTINGVTRTALIRGSGSGGSGSTNANIGSGYRLAVPTTNNIKTVFPGLYLTIDSTTNTNALTVKADSASMAAYFMRKLDSNLYVPQTRLRDTAAALRSVISGSITSSGLTTGRVVIPASSNTITDDAGLTYDATTNRLLTDSLRSIELYADTIRNVNQKIGSMTILFQGNSVTRGTSGPSDTTQKWTQQVSTTMGFTEVNHGVNGRTLEKRTPASSSNMVDDVGSIPTYNGTTMKWLIFDFGINDISQNLAGNTNYNTTNFAADYNTVLSNAISTKGWPANQIVLLSTSYIDSSIQASPVVWGATRRSFDSTTQAVATANGTRFIDIFNVMKVRGGAELISTDLIHPNNYGHKVIAEIVIAALDSIYYQSQTMARSGVSEFDTLKLVKRNFVSTTGLPLGIDSTGRIGIVSTLNGANGYIASKLLLGNASTGIESIIGTGGLKMGYGRFTSPFPSGNPSANCVQLGLYNNGVDAFIENRASNGAQNGLAFQISGGKIVMGGVSFPTDGATILSNGTHEVTGEFRVQGAPNQFSAGSGMRFGFNASQGFIFASNAGTGSNFPISICSFGGNLNVGHSTDVTGLTLNVNGRAKATSMQLGTTTFATNTFPRMWYAGGSVGFDKDSTPTISSITSQFVLVQDTASGSDLGRVKKIAASALGSGNTIYTGDGTLAADRTITGNNKHLIFSGVNNFKVAASVYIWQNNGGTVSYGSRVASTSDNWYGLAYTPTAGVFSKGDALRVDTNNSVLIGSTTTNSHPLYTTGGALVSGNGSVSMAGNFYHVNNLTNDATLNLTYYFVTLDATSNNITITLPAASTAFGGGVGIQYIFKRMDNSGNTVTIQRAGSDTIDGGTSTTLTAQYQVKSIQCITTSAWALGPDK